MAVRMTIWTWGSKSLSRAVHSTPDMRGRKMSMRTTLGGSCGLSRIASSPVAQTQMQEKSGKELINRAQLSRTFGWSSTSATLIGALGDGLRGWCVPALVILALGWIMARRRVGHQWLFCLVEAPRIP